MVLINKSTMVPITLLLGFFLDQTYTKTITNQPLPDPGFEGVKIGKYPFPYNLLLQVIGLKKKLEKQYYEASLFLK